MFTVGRHTLFVLPTLSGLFLCASSYVSLDTYRFAIFKVRLKLTKAMAMNHQQNNISWPKTLIYSQMLKCRMQSLDCACMSMYSKKTRDQVFHPGEGFPAKHFHKLHKFSWNFCKAPNPPCNVSATYIYIQLYFLSAKWSHSIFSSPPLLWRTLLYNNGYYFLSGLHPFDKCGKSQTLTRSRLHE